VNENDIQTDGEVMEVMDEEMCAKFCSQYLKETLQRKVHKVENNIKNCSEEKINGWSAL
jgi:hypothetical protein